MTSRERLLCAFHCGTPDRVPVAPFGFGHVNPDSEVGLRLVAETDFIQCVGGAGSFFGAGLQMTTETDGDRTITVIQTPRGPLRSVRRRTAVTTAQVEFPCKTADDVEKLLSVPYQPPTIDPTHFIRWKDRIGDEGVVLFGFNDAICTPASFFSPEDFCLLWAEAPDAFLELIRVTNERICEQAEACCRAGIDAFRVIGGEYASTQLGPQAYASTVTEPDSELVRVMHDHGALVYYHNHGPVMRYLELIAQIGMDACDCFEAPPWGDCDLRAAHAQIGDRVCIVGNLDDMEIIDKLPTDQVLAIAAQRLDEAGPTAFVLGGTASGTYTERGAENFIAMARMVAQRA
jgi:uroporphyrinogen-III decarboxylase